MRPLKQFILAVLLCCLPLSTATALTEAEEEQLNALLSRAVDISEGAEVAGATIVAKEGWMLQGEDACTFSRLLNADEFCGVSAIVFPPAGSAIDSIYYAAPEDIGYVNMDDWTDDVNSQIDVIWESYVEGSKAQSERIGFDVVPVKWVLYPTLNKASQVMTYGVLLNFGGEEVINLTSVKFTRTGYVQMNVVTDDEMLAAAGTTFDGVSSYASTAYQPSTGSQYADFEDGDRVAAIGAVGVLASVIGVKYSNKGTLAAIGAAILVFAKKFWFVLVAIPVALFGFLKRMLGRRDEAG